MLKINKSACIDGIPVELFKAVRSGLKNEFYQILLYIWNNKDVHNVYHHLPHSRTAAKATDEKCYQHNLQNPRNHD